LKRYPKNALIVVRDAEKKSVRHMAQMYCI